MVLRMFGFVSFQGIAAPQEGTKRLDLTCSMADEQRPNALGRYPEHLWR